MKRLCIFAHYDKDSIIDDYVIYYLKSLKINFDKIIFISDCSLRDSELLKIKDYVDFFQAYPHGEYDWGSYKFGFLIAKENNLLEQFDEILFCNDSVYGPIFPLSPIFERMSFDNCDFWGMYENSHGIEKGEKTNHLQSWFLLLKKEVFTSNLFEEFILSVKKLEEKNEIIQKYEVGFSQIMSTRFKYKTLYSSNKSNAVTQAAPLLLKDRFPFIKTVVVKKYNINLNVVDSYLRSLIIKHSKRVGSCSYFQKIFKTVFWKNKMKKIKIVRN